MLRGQILCELLGNAAEELIRPAELAIDATDEPGLITLHSDYGNPDDRNQHEIDEVPECEDIRGQRLRHRKLLETSHVAAVVELGRLPLSPAARLVVAAEPDIRSRLATGGDDYELLFCAPPDAAESIAALSAQLGVPITMIGRIEAGAGVRPVDSAGQTITVEATGYRHF